MRLGDAVELDERREELGHVLEMHHVGTVGRRLVRVLVRLHEDGGDADRDRGPRQYRHMRALATAVLYLLLNLIGPGAGPLVTGMLNDLFSPSYGAEAVRLSLMVNLLGTGCGIALMIYSANHVLADLRLADEGAETAAPAPAALDA